MNVKGNDVSRRGFLTGALTFGMGAMAMGLTGCGTPRTLEAEAAQNTIDGGEYDIVVVGAGGAGMAAAVGCFWRRCRWRAATPASPRAA